MPYHSKSLATLEEGPSRPFQGGGLGVGGHEAIYAKYLIYAGVTYLAYLA